ncbi:outer membrane protein [Paenibacillus sp. FSL R7-277]|uniref:Ig-like domain-containing protein n=1 Tax=Paenibacillus sp. FSL R7-277 TaxID=1227352 RepID=UPI0003E26AD8|nr:Ig-like domain-containing protein [Paenibacillus sp. FSL R7-277]ETT79474.1 outer membrane protein [Paenibacillus sp. FSL R7-277]
MRKKLRIGTAIIIAGNLLLGLGSPAIGIHTSAVYAASEFGINMSPANGSAFVNVGASLGLGFDRQVIPQAGKITITDVNTETVFTEIAVGSAGLIGNSSSYEIKLGASLKFAPYKTYSVSVPKGLFKDSAGNESAATSWKFTTAPEVNPAITASSMSPAINSRVEAGSLTELSIRLSGVLTAGGGSVRLLSSADNAVIQEFAIRDGEPGVAFQSADSSTTVTLTLANKLPSGGNYYVLIDAYAFKDANNTTYQGIASGSGWSFSTIGTGTISASTAPANASFGASVSGALRLYFDRPMSPASGVISVSPGAGDPRTRWLNVNSTNVTGGGSSTITLLPASTASPLLSGTLYTVTIPQGAFYDQDGHLFPASGPYSWTFTTASLTSLSVTALTPADRSESVDISKTIAVNFNRDVINNSTVTNGVVLYKSNGSKVAATVQQGASAKEFIIKPSATLESDTIYYIDIAKGAFTDAADPSVQYEGLSGTKSWSFRTVAIDKTPPSLTSAVLENNRTIRLRYNETLNASVALLASSFGVTVNEEIRNIESAYIQGDSVFVVISTGIAVGQNVKISYTGGVRTIQDTSGNAAPTFSGQQITNTIESALPTPKEGRITGRTVTLTFNDTLKTVSPYAYDQFMVTTDGYSLGVNSISSSGNTLYLTVGSEVGNSESVRVSYYAGSYPLVSSLGQNIANFAEFNIRNSKDNVPPVFQNATGAGNKILLNYNEGLSTINLPMNSQFSVLVGGKPNYVTNVSVSGSQATLTLQTALPVNGTVTVSYVPGTLGLSDLNGNRAAYVDLQPVSVTSATIVSEISIATVKGNELNVTFTKSMQSSSKLYANQFGIKADGSSIDVQDFSLSGTLLKLNLSQAVTAGQKVELSYLSGAGMITDTNGNSLPSFSSLSVQNLTTAVAGNGSRPSYLGTLPASEFGKEYPLLKSDSALGVTDLSVYKQMVKRYDLNAERMAASYEYLKLAGGDELVFEVPSTEKSAYVTVPLKALSDAAASNKNAKLIIRYGDHMYGVKLSDIDVNSLIAGLGTDINKVSLVLRMESVPGGTFYSFEQKIGTQAMRNVTGLMDLRLTGSIKDNYSNAKELNVKGQYTVRNAAVLNSAQTMAAGVDSTYNDAIYLPAQIATVGSNSVVSARTNGNQVVGVFISLRTFGDMTSHWSKTAVAELAAKNIIDSSYGTAFKPDQPITRSEFAVMLSRGLGLQAVRGGASQFKDVRPFTQTSDFIEAAAKAGIITGNTDGTFRAEDKITREQMAIMMVRALEYTGQPVTLSASVMDTLSPFKDRARILSQSIEFVAKAVKAGIIQGVSTTQFQPQGNATRGQAAVMLQRMLKTAGYL